MQIEPQSIGQCVATETGYPFDVETGTDVEGHRWYLLVPAGNVAQSTFSVRVTLSWRRLNVVLEPGKFALDLLKRMGNTDSAGRASFKAVLRDCELKGAEINLNLNRRAMEFDDEEIWMEVWNRIDLSLKKGQLELGTEDGDPDLKIVCEWTSRFVAAVVAILPIEEELEIDTTSVAGYPEGAVTVVKVNRYERDPRNRAAALAIHGSTCAACCIDMSETYGFVAAGYIEMHHTTPVSRLTEGYVIDTLTDIVPLCSNCHVVAYRRDPPYTVEEIKEFLSNAMRSK